MRLLSSPLSGAPCRPCPFHSPAFFAEVRQWPQTPVPGDRCLDICYSSLHFYCSPPPTLLLSSLPYGIVSAATALDCRAEVGEDESGDVLLLLMPACLCVAAVQMLLRLSDGFGVAADASFRHVVSAARDPSHPSPPPDESTNGV